MVKNMDEIDDIVKNMKEIDKDLDEQKEFLDLFELIKDEVKKIRIYFIKIIGNRNYNG